MVRAWSALPRPAPPLGEATGQQTNYVAAISFGFNGRPLRPSDRFDNPLGFQVTRYRRDAEGLVQ